MERDELTGLLTRKSLFNILQSKENLWVVMIDVDHFKVINDTFGHRVGDNVLKIIGYILKDVEDGEEVFAIRYAGDEFVLLVKKNKKMLNSILESVILKISDFSFKSLEGDRFSVSLSFGVAYHKNSHNYEMSIRNADKALLVSKSTGRNKILFFEDIEKFNIEEKQDLPFIGRERAFRILFNWYKSKNYKFLFVEGVPGIGKSRFLEEAKIFLLPYGLFLISIKTLKSTTIQEYVNLINIMDKIIEEYNFDKDILDYVSETLDNIKKQSFKDFKEILILFEFIIENIEKNIVILIDDIERMNEMELELIHYVTEKFHGKLRIIGSFNAISISPELGFEKLVDIYNNLNSEIIFLEGIKEQDIYRVLLKYYSVYIPLYVINEIYDLTGGNPLLLNKLVDKVENIKDDMYVFFDSNKLISLFKIAIHIIGINSDKILDALIALSFSDKGISIYNVLNSLNENEVKELSIIERNGVVKNRKGKLSVNYRILRDFIYVLPIDRKKRVLNLIEEWGVQGERLYEVFMSVGNMEKAKKSVEDLFKKNPSPNTVIKLLFWIYNNNLWSEDSITLPVMRFLLKYGMEDIIQRIYSNLLKVKNFDYMDVLLRYHLKNKEIEQAESILNKIKYNYGSEEYVPYVIYREYSIDLLKGKKNFEESYRSRIEEYRDSKFYIDTYLLYMNKELFLESRFDEIESILGKILPKAISINYTEGLANIYALLGNMYYLRNSLEESKDMYKNALELYEKEGLFDKIYLLYHNLANVYVGENKWRTALKYYKRALKYARMLRNMQSLANTLNSISTIYLQMGSIDIALNMLDDVFIIASEQGNKRLVAITLNNRGMAYLLKKEYHKSLKYLKESLRIFNYLKIDRYIQTVKLIMSEVYLWIGYKEEAKDILKSIKKINKTAEFLYILVNPRKLEKSELNDIINTIHDLEEDDFDKARYFFLTAFFMKKYNKNSALALLRESEHIYRNLDAHRYLSDVKALYKEIENGTEK